MGNQPQIFTISGHTVRVSSGDLATFPERVDAIVSSDDNYLSHSGGVSRALWAAAGPGLAKAVEEAEPQLHLGDVYVTQGFELPCRLLLHAITMDLDQNRAILEPELAKLYQRLFEAAGAEKCSRVALPLIGTGSAELSVRASTTALVDTLTSGFPSYRGIRTIDVVLHRPEDEVAREILLEAERRERDFEASVAELVDSTEGPIGESMRSTWNQYLTGDASARGLALALFFGHVQDLLQEHRPEAAESLKQLWRSAWHARNRLAHSRGYWDAHDWSTLLGAVREALIAAKPQPTTDALAALEEPESTEEIALAEPATDDESHAATVDSRHFSEDPAASLAATDLDLGFPRPAESRRSVREAQPPLGLSFRNTGPTTSSTTPTAQRAVTTIEREKSGRGTKPLRELRDFLLSHLPEQSREDLRKRFTAEGYKGQEDIQLLEFLIREPDLVEFIASEFGRPILLGAIRKHRSEEPPYCPTAEGLARWFLKTLGFPDPVAPDGLRAVRQAVQRARAKLLVHDDEALRGAIADVARRLEYVARVMLRFVAQAAYRTAPEQLLRQWDKISDGSGFAKASLGNLLIWIEVLNKHLEEDASPAVAVFKRDVAPSSLIPRGADGIAALRNAFSHYRSEDVGRSLSEQARKFLDEAETFLEYLGRHDARVFPRIILIESIQYDRWGRQVISAVDDEGNHERIFTDEPVFPGDTYFMHPLTNPLRVDPILVPAGDLLWLDESPQVSVRTFLARQ